ncbi:MAG TPA: SCO2322 family protein [Nocardioidaceae bacterium]
MATLLPRRIAGVLTSLAAVLVTLTSLAAPAQADEGYQYWNYFHLQDGAWAFSEVGAADHVPADGDVEGFRYGTSTVSQGIEPRADLDEVNFETVCADTEAAEGEKRVAVVVDYGVEEGSGTPPEPRAECAVVAEDASTQQILDEVAQVRLESGMTCALDGYPASGCGAPVKDADVPEDEETVAFAMPPTDDDAAAATDQAAEETDDSGLWAIVGIAALVVVIALAAVLLGRRRRAA